MVILHIIVGLKVGGAELMLKRLIEFSQNDSHFKHIVISMTCLGEVGLAIKSTGVEVRELGMKSMFDTPRAFLRLVRLIRHIKPDVVQTWMYHSDFLGGVAAKFASCKKIIWSIRCTNTLTLRGSSISGYFSMKLCSWLSWFVPQKILCVAHKAMEQHINYGYDSSKMSVIQNGFNLNICSPEESIRAQVRKNISINIDSLVIGSVARFNAYKDHHNFVNAALNVIKKFPKTIFSPLSYTLVPKSLSGTKTKDF